MANRLVPGSYLSLQAALSHYHLIPEAFFVMTSVTGGRPGRWDTPLGTYDYRHLQSDMLTGFRRLALAGGQEALVATPEKALLDLVYLEPEGDAPAYLVELRLQNMNVLNLDELRRLAEDLGKPKLRRAAGRIAELAEAREYQPLE